MYETPQDFREMSLEEREGIYLEIGRILRRRNARFRQLLSDSAKFDKIAPELEQALNFSKDEIKAILNHIRIVIELSPKEVSFHRVCYWSARLPNLDQIESRRDPNVQYEARYGIWRSE